MNITLSQTGVSEFIEQACRIAITVNEPLLGGSSHDNPIAFDVFVKIISKFIRSPVELEVTIEQNSPSSMPVLLVHGIRDHGIRNGQGRKYLPGHQKGAWSYYLYDALRDGIPSEHLKMLRENINLLPEYGIDNDKFFQIPTTFFKE